IRLAPSRANRGIRTPRRLPLPFLTARASASKTCLSAPGRLHDPPPPLASTSKSHRSTRRMGGLPRHACGSGSLGHLCERLPARFGDPHARNVGLSTAVDHALALRGRESGLEQVEQHVDRESVCPHHRLGATLPARGEQFEGAAAVRIGAAVVVWPSHRCATVISAPARRWIRRAETCYNALGRGGAP